MADYRPHPATLARVQLLDTMLLLRLAQTGAKNSHEDAFRAYELAIREIEKALTWITAGIFADGFGPDNKPKR
ncbi:MULTISPECIES: hypothetical protein [unclassified Pseudomonas]|uniref:hypothetical protein n=1 Tax=unclassified Pseudomonas TaxID=196821 RepID=UPI001C60C83E|nr:MULTISPECIES: hypothetical protein [unclassified Pseudomonas]MBW5416125.1 hypothetical protein [Pseudomonas sp. MAG002Y]